MLFINCSHFLSFLTASDINIHSCQIIHIRSKRIFLLYYYFSTKNQVRVKKILFCFVKYYLLFFALNYRLKSCKKIFCLAIKKYKYISVTVWAKSCWTKKIGCGKIKFRVSFLFIYLVLLLLFPDYFWTFNVFNYNMSK